MEVHTVVIRRYQLRITLRQILCVRHIVDILQVANIGILCIRVHKDTDGILWIERDVTHHKVGNVVEIAHDILTLNQTIEHRVLIVDISNKRIAILSVAETRTHTVLHATTIGHRR